VKESSFTECSMMTNVSPNRRFEMANHRGGSGNFAEDRERASEAGRKGGQHSGGNFKNDPQRASEAGKKGGKSSHGSSRNS
jgi:general stress protein YciG